MILISFVLCLAAIVVVAVSAIAGYLLGLLPAEAALVLVYSSIGISMVAFVLLAVGTFRARAEIFGGAAAGRKGSRPGDGSATTKTKAKTAGRPKSGPGRAAPSRPARPGGRAPRAGSPRSAAAARDKPALAAEIPADATVVVVPGRRRYHLANCRQLFGRTREDLTYEEAREEGFTACTACMPDVALAARASAGEPAEPEGSDAEPEPGGDEASGSEAVAEDEAPAPAGDSSGEPDPGEVDTPTPDDGEPAEATGEDEEAGQQPDEGAGDEVPGDADATTEVFAAVTESTSGDTADEPGDDTSSSSPRR